MEPYTRYAVYFTPGPGPLCDFMAGWMGWDPTAGRACNHPALPGLPAPVSQITATPRRYGFHGTLKPPFRLASGSSRSQLCTDFDALAATLAPAEVEGLRIARLGGFLALVPDGDMGGDAADDMGDTISAVARIAAEAVAGLDRHRAPAPAQETERRRAAGLTPRQEAHLVTWGYPYVMDEFRFHMTLTGRLDRQAMDAVDATLRPLLAPLLPRPFVLGSMSLMGEDPQGFFHTLRNAPFAG